MTLREHTEQSRKAYLLRVLAMSKSLRQAARMAGVNRTTIYQLLVRYEIPIPDHIPRMGGTMKLPGCSTDILRSHTL